MSERGKIYNRERARQQRDFHGLLRGKITPTDFDCSVEYHDKAWVWVEEKYRGNGMPPGQELAIKRLTDDLERSGKKTLFIIASHNVSDTSEDIVVADTEVMMYRHLNEWKKPLTPKTVKELYDSFLNSIDMNVQWKEKSSPVMCISETPITDIIVQRMDEDAGCNRCYSAIRDQCISNYKNSIEPFCGHFREVLFKR